jgi:hypothetical protein
LLGDVGDNLFSLTSDFEKMSFAVGGEGNDVYEIQEGSCSIIYDITGNNTLRFPFEISSIIYNIPAEGEYNKQGKYLLIEPYGNNIDICILEYDSGVWLKTSVCTLLNGTKFNNIQKWDGSNWVNAD